ncbi:hypothetical protein K0U00_16995, partial [Paenibacillus sepulcri]|nr:hypothetical protein [Paenibacillus sepulcri]
MNSTHPRSSRQRIWIAAAVIGGLILLFAVIFMLLLHRLQSDGSRSTVSHPAANYEYMTTKASNGIELDILKSRPSNVTLERIDQNVTLSDYYGINGGFFFEGDLLSIAMVDGFPVAGAEEEYGSGYENVKYPRGTLAWDGAKDELSVQIVAKASELKVTDPNRFWAQGGISMSIGHDDIWRQQADQENAPFPDDKRLRSAMVYDSKGMIYLVVSGMEGTLSDFRDAIL